MREKQGFPEELILKSRTFQGGLDKIDWKSRNPGGKLQKKMIFSIRGYNFFLEVINKGLLSKHCGQTHD